MTASTASRFRAAVSKLERLDPFRIYEAICADPVDTGIKATSYDGDRVTGSRASSHPERTAERAHPDWAVDPTDPTETRRPRPAPSTAHHRRDLARVDGAGQDVLYATATLNAICREQGAPWDPDQWDAWAWHKALDILAELADGLVQAAADVGRDVTEPIAELEDAATTLETIHNAYMPHPPRQIDMHRTTIYCRNHLLYGIERKRVTSMLCQWCWRQLKDLEPLGDLVELQLDLRMWPSELMVRAHEDGRARDVTRYRRDWLASHGISSTARRTA